MNIAPKDSTVDTPTLDKGKLHQPSFAADNKLLYSDTKMNWLEINAVGDTLGVTAQSAFVCPQSIDFSTDRKANGLTFLNCHGTSVAVINTSDLTTVKVTPHTDASYDVKISVFGYDNMKMLSGNGSNTYLFRYYPEFG